MNAAETWLHDEAEQLAGHFRHARAGGNPADPTEGSPVMGDVVQVAERVAEKVAEEALAALKADERYAPLVVSVVEKIIASLGVVAGA